MSPPLFGSGLRGAVPSLALTCRGYETQHSLTGGGCLLVEAPSHTPGTGSSLFPLQFLWGRKALSKLKKGLPSEMGLKPRKFLCCVFHGGGFCLQVSRGGTANLGRGQGHVTLQPHLLSSGSRPAAAVRPGARGGKSPLERNV